MRIRMQCRYPRQNIIQMNARNVIYEYVTNKLWATENTMGQYNQIADAIMVLGSYYNHFGMFDSEQEYFLRIY